MSILKDWRSFAKAERQVYRTDVVQLLCRGLGEPDETTLKRGVHLEQGIYYLSRLYVPFRLWRLYKKGVFGESFSFTEVSYMLRMLVVMHGIDLSGHFLFKLTTLPTYKKHMVQMDSSQGLGEYMEQKNYFTQKKSGKLG